MAYPPQPAAAPAKKPENYLLQLGILLVLLAALLFTLIHFRVAACDFIHPAGCDIYYSLVAGGKPGVLIVHGDAGIGDPEYMYDVLRSPRFGARVSIRGLEEVSLPVLMESQLVIVERARVMGTDELRMFTDYVSRGGKLVWVGDAGTAAPAGESGSDYFLRYGEREAGGSQEFIGPWARKDGSKQFSFDHLLGVEYKANYCELVQCGPPQGLVGHFKINDTGKRLVLGISQALPYYGDFAVVGQNDDAYQEVQAYLDYGESLIGTPPANYIWLGNERTNFGRELPLIVSSGLGGRVAYYAFAPESVVGPGMPVDGATMQPVAYWGVLENMYYGMLYK